MSTGEVAFLCLVVGAFLTFIGSVGFVSIWSRKPRTTAAEQAAAQPDVLEASTYRKAA